MMTLEARKLDLIQRLSVVEDEATLHIVDEVLSTNTGHTDWQLSDEQKQFVKESIAELDADMGIPHEDVMREVREKFKV